MYCTQTTKPSNINITERACSGTHNISYIVTCPQRPISSQSSKVPFLLGGLLARVMVPLSALVRFSGSWFCHIQYVRSIWAWWRKKAGSPGEAEKSLWIGISHLSFWRWVWVQESNLELSVVQYGLRTCGTSKLSNSSSASIIATI